MSNPNLRLFLTLTVLIKTALLGDRIADACQPPPCIPASAEPRGGTAVPANLPAFVYSPALNNWKPEEPTSDGFQIVDPDDKPVAVSFSRPQGSRAFVVTPSAPLAPGKTYRIRYPQVCAGNLLPQMRAIAEQTFTTTEAVPLPRKLGSAKISSLRPDKIRLETSRTERCSAQVTEVMAVIATIALDPSPELRAYFPIAGLWVHAPDAHPRPVRLRAPRPAEPITFDLYSVCGESPDPIVDRGLPPKKQTIELHAALLGTAEKPDPVSIEVDLRCATKPGNDVPGAGATPGTGATPAPEVSDGTGCSLSRGHDPGAGALMLLGFVLLALRRPKAWSPSRQGLPTRTGARH